LLAAEAMVALQRGRNWGGRLMVNEHHSTATCRTVSVPMALAILARETKRARLSLGTPIANRPDPVRVAEEMAWLDVLSGGRLEMGLVKGAPYEIAPANSNPANLMRRYWEAHDLILKAMSTTDGPFNWEGEFFHYRNVNIWPRPVPAANATGVDDGLERRGSVSARGIP
jgi:alkanesulfonate monooxygenase SsuD/methylene tetrahydromethanopterin reductase-like flavin-dependent oxidoreductase (luciferase family)